MEQTVKILMVAEVKTDDVEPVLTARDKIDAFRDAVLPGENYGVTLTTATREDLEGFASQQALLPNPRPITE